MTRLSVWILYGCEIIKGFSAQCNHFREQLFTSIGTLSHGIQVFFTNTYSFGIPTLSLEHVLFSSLGTLSHGVLTLFATHSRRIHALSPEPHMNVWLWEALRAPIHSSLGQLLIIIFFFYLSELLIINLVLSKQTRAGHRIDIKWERE